MASPHNEVVDQAIWAMGNLAGDSHKVRDLVINEGAVLLISNFLDKA
jgi:importin subunit alpha-6/7